MDEKPIEELESSELGTKEYWEKSYETEIQNYRDHGDVGEVWFDEDSQLRIIRWIEKQEALICQDDPIIDLGCGNGMMLVEMAREGYSNLTGIDYSPKAVELAQAISKDQDVHITYKVADLLDKSNVTSLGTFKVVHDKGTYDAISLHPEDSKSMRQIYICNVHQLLQTDGLFILTSCNWTQMELVKSFEEHFSLHQVIPTPSFTFGGAVGNVVTSVVFKKK
ncbi:EEF1A lysine methyltransferase 2 [Malaya genurostris]|uniref:EEF1A lysine methyltransferase 2 n=1 Tax=Malaya genurostris TaxID=325434 RepID=UPI0026F386BA|nr:EEF1A lysine methyltransferase 2 [Malaya genurostris]XP_058460110.1 EEF1A lysine methyltransferase 2 [Malaya genurostris]XP_058460111.1 EEF1A lysine methyltransferase 2 [Malaya genurostris]